MAGLQRTFRGAYPKPAIASYDYIDVSEGSGIVVLYGIAGTSANTFTRETIPSNKVVQYGQMTGDPNVKTKALDVDYDLMLNYPKTIKGKAVVAVSIGFNSIVNETNIISAKALIRKWDGTTETEIVSKESDTYEKLGVGIFSRTMLIEMDVPETNFKAGEYLRLTIEFYGTRPLGAAGSPYCGFGNDPADRNDSTDYNPQKIINDVDTTKLQFNCPFKIDL